MSPRRRANGREAGVTLAALQEKYHDFYAPRFVLELDGEEYEHEDGVVSSVSVDGAAEKADRFSLTLENVFDQRRGEFSGLDWRQFAAETAVTIKIGYGTAVEVLLVGSIAEQKPEFPESGAPRVEISGYGLQHEMNRGSESRSWDEKTDREVVEDVADNYRFDRVAVEATTVTHPKTVQDDETDLAFLERLADRNSADGRGFQVSVRRDEVYFGPVRDTGESGLELRYGDGLRSFSPEYKTGSQVASVTVSHWDEGSKSSIEGSAERDGPGTGTEVVRRPVRSETEAEQVANARLSENARQRLTGRGEAIGLPEIRAGELVTLTGLGSRFSGRYYVTEATHRVDGNGYTTSFRVRLPDEEELE